ncbi:hypothetical protein [Dickeya dianthicola]|uniref:hypothetical protein n=3 Tax=Dickeya dianthicola TaxID=204039 RepID=UPI0003A4BB4D|nr:hypothetical protein [Dickeya dianthicola]ATO33152.1 hypothetical protein DDI_1984 [Dickeya dianthicola RNS04.9]MBI0438055.1 hypothetical protein [Dickeya dianthicola]MBI0451213.1 hypothetical protein [Dickeya dianthicola]MBI0452938.1 hypothetical protein [Dickeya dianthicola]MBI0456425.1 hypothetical protein [Dickeya dianthicola]
MSERSQHTCNVKYDGYKGEFHGGNMMTLYEKKTDLSSASSGGYISAAGVHQLWHYHARGNDNLDDKFFSISANFLVNIVGEI